MMEKEQLEFLGNNLKKMRLSAMARQLKNLSDDSYCKTNTVEQIVADLIMAEVNKRNNKKISLYLKEAQLRYNGAAYNESMTSPGSGVTPETLEKIQSLHWIPEGKNILITGATGTGKSYLASAIGAQAVTHFYTVRYKRVNLLLNDIHSSEVRGELSAILDDVAQADVLILDDFGMKKLNTESCRSLFELLESREGRNPTIIVSQLPVSDWYQLFENFTYADVCMDRILHKAIRIELKGDSRRKRSESA